jgi:hypothetical protein
MSSDERVRSLIADAIFESQITSHLGKAAGNISRESSRVIAAAIFDALSRANVQFIEKFRQTTAEENCQTTAEDNSQTTAEDNWGEWRGPRIHPDTSDDLNRFVDLSRALPDVEHVPEQETTDSKSADTRSGVKRKVAFGRVAVRLLLATVIVGLLIGAYSYSQGNIELALLTKFFEGVTGSAPMKASISDAARASLHQVSAKDPNAPSLDGSASWQILSEQTGPNASAVLRVDIKIPAGALSIVIFMHRETGDIAAISHMLEIRFIQPEQTPSSNVARISSVVMTTAERSPRAVLSGEPIKVAPGFFLFGLSAAKEHKEENLRFLRELTWMDIALGYEDGSQAVLSIEKGTTGERLLNQFLAG